MTKRLVAHHATVPFTFRLLGQPLDPEISPLISARCAGDITLRLVAQQQRSTASRACYGDPRADPHVWLAAPSDRQHDRASGLHPGGQHENHLPGVLGRCSSKCSNQADIRGLQMAAVDLATSANDLH